MYNYYDVLKMLAEKNKDERMPCTGPDKIQQWYRVVFQQPYTKIRVFANDLSFLQNEFMMDLLDKYLYNPWASIQILLKEDCDLSWFHHNNKNGNLEIRIAVGSYSKQDAKEFAVADDHCYRFESSFDLAICNFHNYEDSIILIQAFDKAFSFGTAKSFRTKPKESNNDL
jgi:hypothetical protein